MDEPIRSTSESGAAVDPPAETSQQAAPRRRPGRRLSILLIAGAIVPIAVAVHLAWLDGAATAPPPEPPAGASAEQLTVPTTPQSLIEEPVIETTPHYAPASVTTSPPSPSLPSPSSMPSQSTTTTLPILTEEVPGLGEPVGRIEIPDLGVDQVLVEGVAPPQLALGPGHMPGTPLPGQPGNAVISGHRTTYGAPFNRLGDLTGGEVISIETGIGIHTYQVTEIHVVEPTALWVIDARGPATLTLTTCHPPGSNRQRLVVFADLVAGPNGEALLDPGLPRRDLG